MKKAEEQVSLYFFNFTSTISQKGDYIAKVYYYFLLISIITIPVMATDIGFEKKVNQSLMMRLDLEYLAFTTSIFQNEKFSTIVKIPTFLSDTYISTETELSINYGRWGFESLILGLGYPIVTKSNPLKARLGLNICKFDEYFNFRWNVIPSIIFQYKF